MFLWCWVNCSFTSTFNFILPPQKRNCARFLHAILLCQPMFLLRSQNCCLEKKMLRDTFSLREALCHSFFPPPLSKASLQTGLKFVSKTFTLSDICIYLVFGTEPWDRLVALCQCICGTQNCVSSLLAALDFHTAEHLSTKWNHGEAPELPECTLGMLKHKTVYLIAGESILRWGKHWLELSSY